MASGGTISRTPWHVNLRIHQRRLRHVLRLEIRNFSTASTSSDCNIEEICLYFTIEESATNQVVYKSEVIEGSRNPQWSAISFQDKAFSSISVLTTIDIVLWYAKPEQVNQLASFNMAWRQTLQLNELCYFGPIIYNEGRNFPNNTIFIGTKEGFLCALDSESSGLDYQGIRLVLPHEKTASVESAHLRESYSMDHLQKLVNNSKRLHLCQNHLEVLQSQITDVLKRKRQLINMQTASEVLKAKILQLKNEINQAGVEKVAEVADRNESQGNILLHDSTIKPCLMKMKENVMRLSQYLECLRSNFSEERKNGSNRKKIMIKELSSIFDIDAVSGSKALSICHVPLPEFEEVKETKLKHVDKLGYPLGFVAQVVDLLARLLGKPLRFPITVYGSQCTIADDISPNTECREFALYNRKDPKGYIMTGYELLGQDILQLRQYCNLPVGKSKSILYNLKDLFDKTGAHPGSDKLNQHTAKSPRSDSDAILVQDGFLLVPHLPLSSKHSSCTGSTSSSPGLADIPKEDQFGPSSPSKKENESNDDGSSTSGSFPTADLVYSITT